MADQQRTTTSTQADDNNGAHHEYDDDEPPSPGPEDSAVSPDNSHMASFFRGSNSAASSSENLDPETNANEYSLLVVLQPDGIRHRVLVTADCTVQALADQIASDLRLNPDLIAFPDLEPAPGLTQSETTLEAMGINSSTMSDGSERVVYASVSRKLSNSEYVMPDVIQVRVFDDATQAHRTISVEIVKFDGRKLYLGGFRHCKTQQIFHHASAQTLLTRARRTYGPRAHRDTQTQVLTTRSAQTKRESGTQMERRDLLLDTSRDRTVSAQPYFDSFQQHCLRVDSVVLIQRLYRGYQARAYVHFLREQKRKAAVMTHHEAKESALQDVDYQKREVHRRMHPTTVGDFEVLYNELDKWRQVETRKVHEDRALASDGEAKQAAIEAILAKETKLLQTIDRLRLTANDKNRKQRIESMLQFMSRPKQWQMSDGGVKEVHTPFTIRAKELADLYHGLKTPLASLDERLDVLLHVKWTVKEFECVLTREIIELIDREADMLNRGRKEKSLEGLRKRLNNLFLQFVENPEFNPEAAVALQQRSLGQ